jgi:hypothetical protein
VLRHVLEREQSTYPDGQHPAQAITMESQGSTRAAADRWSGRCTPEKVAQ